MNAADIVLILILAGAFLIGFFQGVVKSALNVFAWGIAFALAANLRDPIGNYLAGEWTSLDPEFDHMIAFGASAVVILLLLMIVVQLGTHGPSAATRYPLLDDLLGGALGVFVAILIVASAVIVLESYYMTPSGLGTRLATPQWTQDLYSGLTTSRIATSISDNLLPILGTIFGGIVPDVIRKVMV